MLDFRILEILVHLGRMTILKENNKAQEQEGNLSKQFEVKIGPRQGSPISSTLLSIKKMCNKNRHKLNIYHMWSMWGY